MAAGSINLISSAYFDDDDDEMDDAEPAVEPSNDDKDPEGASSNRSEERAVDSNEDTPPLTYANSVPEPMQKPRPLTPEQQPLPSPNPSPQQQAAPPEASRSRMGRLTIVDYDHDEVAMSPEAEEGEIVANGFVMFGAQLQTSNGDMQDRNPIGTAQLLTSSTQEIVYQSSHHLDAPESHTMNNEVNESEFTEITEDPVELSKEIEPLDRFLPPPPTIKCSDELQDRIQKFLKFKGRGKSYNAEVRNKKQYRNPDFLRHAVTYQDIDEIGSCFSKDVFDPHGYDKSDFYDEIEADMKRELERKEQEKKKIQKVELVPGGLQPGLVAAVTRVPIPGPGITCYVELLTLDRDYFYTLLVCAESSTEFVGLTLFAGISAGAAGGLPPVPAAVDSTTRDGRQNKKSKWDKVDGDSASTGASHAPMLTAANAGTGYTAFAQQRRREAEERRSSERRSERRS